eukprot:CAMPEP_0196784500 /NCGR_PEP_ID=MMETSP1104-20130614/17105_1 /TAXON_ID=33652 /ORGANISM="Cafeteria sp., Strain Caron Lab Isolate" /LENGTH=46 /DNA_ID= /DNA_START= /DNA_END= /DNA_ORIENTATION=
MPSQPITSFRVIRVTVSRSSNGSSCPASTSDTTCSRTHTSPGCGTP